SISQVTGLITDAGASPGGVLGSAGSLSNVYVSGSSSSAALVAAANGVPGSAAGAVIVRRRINGNGVEIGRCCDVVTVGQVISPFLRNFGTGEEPQFIGGPFLPWATQGGNVTRV